MSHNFTFLEISTSLFFCSVVYSVAHVNGTTFLSSQTEIFLTQTATNQASTKLLNVFAAIS